jgi:hypothetical protein
VNKKGSILLKNMKRQPIIVITLSEEMKSLKQVFSGKKILIQSYDDVQGRYQGVPNLGRHQWTKGYASLLQPPSQLMKEENGILKRLAR